MKKLIIYEDEDHTLTRITEEVLRQLENGNTSGVNPSWEIEELQETKIQKFKVRMREIMEKENIPMIASSRIEQAMEMLQ